MALYVEAALHPFALQTASFAEVFVLSVSTWAVYGSGSRPSFRSNKGLGPTFVRCFCVNAEAAVLHTAFSMRSARPGRLTNVLVNSPLCATMFVEYATDSLAELR